MTIHAGASADRYARLKMRITPGAIEILREAPRSGRLASRSGAKPGANDELILELGGTRETSVRFVGDASRGPVSR